MPPGQVSEGRTVSRRDALVGLASAGTMAVAGCVKFRRPGQDGSGLSGTIDIRGSSTVYPLMQAVAEEFSERHDAVAINTTPTGTGAGFSDYFCTGASDFNNASREIREQEVQNCAANSIEYLKLKLATDAITVVVNNDADFLDCLTVDELARIWRRDGGADRWSDVRSSFPDRPIARFGASDTSGTYDYFTTNIIGEDGNHTTDYQGTENDNNILAGVQGDRFAIGYLGFAYYYNDPGAVKAVGIDQGEGCVEPSLETAASGDYGLLSRPLFTYVSRSALRRDVVAEFARYALMRSTSRSLVADDVGYVPNAPETMGVELDRLNDAIDEVQE